MIVPVEEKELLVDILHALPAPTGKAEPIVGGAANPCHG
jgi:hypothetical protein